MVQCHRGAAAEIPTKADLIDFLGDCPEVDREDAHQRLTALLGAPSVWAVFPLTPLTLAVLQRANKRDTDQWNALPWDGPADAEVWAYLGGNIATVHAHWVKLDEDKRADLKQPLLPIVRAWLARPRPVATRHIISIQDRGAPPVEPRPGGRRLRPAVANRGHAARQDQGVASRGHHGGGRARGIGQP